MVEQFRSVDLADLRRWRMLDPSALAKTGRIPGITWNTPDGLDKLGVLAKSDGVLFLRRDRQGQLGQFFVPFDFTSTMFHGRRAWFKCPGCGQGCRVLYGTNTLRCRKCCRLRYQSQYQTRAFRLLDRAHKIRRRLGKPGASGDPLPPKPRGMRWQTYRRIEWLVSQLEARGWAAMSVYVGALSRRIR
jgi:hypothetical protein